ncbi:MAG: hypothetical protein EBT09_03480, partial [Actinobacteria bacterium]|nr:hypothetical protein [Actinomycetota bacterium]
ASVALNETPFTAFNFEKFVPGDVFIRPVQVTNSTASNSGAINVNYYMTIKDNTNTTCSVADPTCPTGKGTLSDTVNGLRVVAIRCFSDAIGTTNVQCESNNLRSVRLIKGVMETVWPGGASAPGVDNAGVLRDRNPTVQFGNVGGTGTENTSDFPGLPNAGKADDFFGRPIIFAKPGPLSQQPVAVKINPRRNDTNNPASAGTLSGTSTSSPVVQGSDVLRIGGTIQDLDGNWSQAAKASGSVVVASPSSQAGCASKAISTWAGSTPSSDLNGCGGEVVGVPIQTLSNPNCNGLGTGVENRAVPNATGNAGNFAGPGANATVVSLADAALNRQIFSSQSHGACFMGGPKFEVNSPVVLSPRINNQLMASGSGETPRIVSDIPAQSLFDTVNTIAGLQAGATDNIALIVYLPSWATQSTQDETGNTALKVATRTGVDAQGQTVQIPSGGVGGTQAGGTKASYTVAFTAVQPVGQTFALANSAQQAVNTLAALAGQVRTADVAMQAQSTDLGTTASTQITGGIQVVSPNLMNQNSTQVVTVTGRGFAKVTAIPVNVKLAAATGGTLAAGTSRYVVTAASGPTITNKFSWTQGEPSQDVTIDTPALGKVTITWNNVPDATHYNVFRFDTDSAWTTRTPTKTMTFPVASAPVDSLTADQLVAAAASGSPTKRYFVGTTTSGFVDTGATADYETSAVPYPAANRPCLAYNVTAAIGMCPKVEISNAAGVAISPTILRTGEVIVKAKDASKSPLQDVGLIQDVSAYFTDRVKSEFRGEGSVAAANNTVGYTSTNQVSFQIKASTSTGQANSAVALPGGKYTVKITNPSHKSLPLDVRSKFVEQVGAFQVIEQTIPAGTTTYTPSRIGQISSNNQVVISGTGFQQGAIVHLGVIGSEGIAGTVVRGGTTFLSKSHIPDRVGATSKALGTFFTGYGVFNTSTGLEPTAVGTGAFAEVRDDTVTALTSAYNTAATAAGLPNVSFSAGGGLAPQELGNLGPAAAVPFFSYKHADVTINSDRQITIKNIVVTAGSQAGNGIAGLVAAKVYNPDGSEVIGAEFTIAKPGISQIVQVLPNNKVSLSAPQGQTVTLQYRTELTACAANPTCPTSGAASEPVTYNGTPQLLLANGALGITCPTTNTTPVTCGSDDPSGGVYPVGDIVVLPRTRDVSGKWYDVAQGQVRIAPNAQKGLRLFTMQNGDKAVFSNYMSISATPTVSSITYPSGIYRVLAGGTAATADSKAYADYASTSSSYAGTTATAGAGVFNVSGKLPRATTRRVLLTGTNFNRGSYAPMPDPLSSNQEYGVSRSNKYFSTSTADEQAAPTITVNPSRGITISNIQVVKLQDTVEGNKLDIGLTGAVSTGIANTSGPSDDKQTVNDAVGGTAATVERTRLTAVITTGLDAVSGPVTLTITNPDGGSYVMSNAIVIDGTPTLDVSRNAVLTNLAGGGSLVTGSDASIKQGAEKKEGNAIFIYGSGFYTDGQTPPTVQVSGSGVRVTKVTLGVNPAATSPTSDTQMYDTVMRVELAAESTAPTGKRYITVILPDGQSVNGDTDKTPGTFGATDVTLEVTTP